MPCTEPVRGIKKYARTTGRYRKSLLWACETFADLKAVRHHYRCSAGYLYQNLYAELERKQRARQHPWPKTIGIDEHFFKRDKRCGYRHFATTIVDYKRKRVMELVERISTSELKTDLAYIPGRENVRYVVMDLCTPFRNYRLRRLNACA